jgi:superkiller protein 3
VAALQPERKGVRLQTASWLLEDGDAENAVSLAKREQEIDPDNPTVFKVLFLAMQDAAASKEELEAVATQWVAKAPDNPEAMVRLAGVKAARGDFAGAEELYRKIAAVDPANADRMFYNVGASILNQQGVGEEDRRRAVEAFKQAIAINPNNAKAHLQMGNAYAGLGEMDNAKAAWREFIKLQPDSADAKALKDLVK